MPGPYRYSTPVRAKSTNLLGALFAGLGAGGETTVEDEKKRKLFLEQHPELASSDTSVAPTFQRPKSSFKDFFSGGEGSRAANRYNMQSMLNYDDFVRAKALADYERAQELANIPKVAGAREEVALKQAPRAIQPGQVPFTVSDPEAYISQFGPYNEATSAGLAENARIRSSRILGTDAANAGVLARANILGGPGVTEEVRGRVNPAATSSLVSQTKAEGQKAGEELTTSKQRTGYFMRNPSYIPRGLELQQETAEKGLESAGVTRLSNNSFLANGKVYTTVEEGIDPSTGQFRSGGVFDAQGRKVSGIIPSRSMRSSVGSVSPYRGPKSTTEISPETDNRITTPIESNIGTRPATDQTSPRGTSNIQTFKPSPERISPVISTLQQTNDPAEIAIILSNLGYDISGLTPDKLIALKNKILSGQ